MSTAPTPIETLVTKSLKLASPPVIYNQINDLLCDPNSSADDISRVISIDPALTARLLKVVNSSFYGFPSQIESISRAITIIGTRELTHLVLATSVIDAFKGIPANIVNIKSFWRNSLACAIASKLLAAHCGYHATERFFISGLLHDIGSLVLYQTLPDLALEAINKARQSEKPIIDAEKQVMGFDHTEVGLALTRVWRLPESLEEVVRYYHIPTRAKKFPAEVAVIHIADIMVYSSDLIQDKDKQIPSYPLDPKVNELLNIDEAIFPDILNQVKEQLDDLTTAIISS